MRRTIVLPGGVLLILGVLALVEAPISWFARALPPSGPNPRRCAGSP